MFCIVLKKLLKNQISFIRYAVDMLCLGPAARYGKLNEEVALMETMIAFKRANTD